MTPQEKDLIATLLGRLKGVARQPKDAEAEALIRQAVAEQPDMPAHRQAGASRPVRVGLRQVDLALVAGGQGPLRALPGPVVEETVADDAEFLGARVAVHDVTERVDDHDAVG